MNQQTEAVEDKRDGKLAGRSNSVTGTYKALLEYTLLPVVISIQEGLGGLGTGAIKRSHLVDR